jgi:hypothetical protein
MYVYVKAESTCYTVGFYDPTGKFVPESDHKTPDDAADRVAWLNGQKYNHNRNRIPWLDEALNTADGTYRP